MNPLTISFKANTTPGYHPTINFNSTVVDREGKIIGQPIPRPTHKVVVEPPIQFISMLVHEARNPLTNISLSVEMLEGRMKNDDLKVYVDIIKRNSIRLNEIITGFLKFQHDDNVGMETFSLCELLDEVVDMACDKIILKDISVRKDYDREDHTSLLNKTTMRIALTNIVINAIDAMDRGGKLTLVTRSTNDKFSIQIQDNGHGISKVNLKRIFKPFFTNKPGGLGLGLAATYDILRANHIGIKAESEVGKGTSFVLSFDKDQSR